MNEEAMPVHPCTRAEQLLPEYWQGELNAAGRAWSRAAPRNLRRLR